MDESKEYKEFSSEALAAVVVAYRALGICKDDARNAMIELARRKEAGDTFDVEAFVQERLVEVPKTPQLQSW
jgi:hypothetical protein